MADIRSYTKEKKKREHTAAFKNSRLRLVKSENEESFRDKIHRHRMDFFYRVLLSLIICGTVVALVALQYKNKTYESYDVVSSAGLEWAGGTTVIRLGNNLLTYSKDGAHCTDSKGNVLWDQTYEMQNPIVTVCGSVAAVGDYNGRNIYLLSSEKQLGSITTNLPLRDLAVAENGVVAAVLEDSAVTWIYIYDSAGTELLRFRTTMKDSGYPVSVSLSPNALLCAVSYVYVHAGMIKSSVAFYNFDEYGKNQIGNLVGGYDCSDTVVPYVQFMDNSHIFAVGDDCLMFYSGTQKPEHQATYYFDAEIRGVYYSQNYVGVVFYNSSGASRYKLEIYDQRGNRIRTQDISMDYTDIVFDGDTYIVYGEEECMISTIQGRVKYDGIFRETVHLLLPSGSRYRYYLMTDDSLDMIQMR